MRVFCHFCARSVEISRAPFQFSEYIVTHTKIYPNPYISETVLLNIALYQSEIVKNEYVRSA